MTTPSPTEALKQDLLSGFAKLLGVGGSTSKIIIHDTELDCIVTTKPSPQTSMICVIAIDDMLSDVRKKHVLFRVRDVSFLFEKDTKQQPSDKKELPPTIIRVTGWHKPIAINPIPDPPCESMQLLLMMTNDEKSDTDDIKTTYKRKGKGNSDSKHKEEEEQWKPKKRQKIESKKDILPSNHFLNTPSLIAEVKRCMDSTNVLESFHEQLKPIVTCVCSLQGNSTPMDVKCVLMENPRKPSGDISYGLFVTGYTSLSRNMLSDVEAEIKKYLVRQTGSVNVNVLTRIALTKHALDLSLSW